MSKTTLHFYFKKSDVYGIKTRRILINDNQSGGKTLMSEKRVMAALPPSESFAW